MRQEFVYDQRMDGQNPERFYAGVAVFSARVVAEIDRRAAGAGLKSFGELASLRDPPRRTSWPVSGFVPPEWQ